MRHSSITLEVYFRKVWKLLLRRLHHSDDIRVKSYVRIILGHPIVTTNYAVVVSGNRWVLAAMAEPLAKQRERMTIWEAEAAVWLKSHPPPTDTSFLYETLLTLPFLLNMSRCTPFYLALDEMFLEAAFTMGRKGLPIPLPRCRSECACADLRDLDVQKIHLSGSARERSDVRIFAQEGSDIDLMFQIGPVTFDGPGEQSTSDAAQLETGAAGSDGAVQQGLKLTQERTAQPGFVLLRHQRLESCRHTDPLPFDASRVVGLMDTFRLQATKQPSSQSGPSVSSTYQSVFANGDGKPQVWASIDLVACVLCPIWLHEDFASRQRPSGFPAPWLVEKLCNTPVFLVPVGFRGSPTEKLEWRISFSRHEYVVYRSMTEKQRLCLTTLKHCRAVIGEAAKPLKSYYLKTALMWLAESRPADQWTLNTMYDSLLLILRYVDVCLRRGYMPCYFKPEVNLLASRSETERAELAAAVAELRRRLLPAALALMADWLGQPAATLAQTLLVDCRPIPSPQLDSMANARILIELARGEPRPAAELLYRVMFEKGISGQVPPYMPLMTFSLMINSGIARSSSGNALSGMGVISTGIGESLIRVANLRVDPVTVKDSWMVEE